jgi:hypothetical protein
MAKYYDFNSDYLIEKEAGVRHDEVSSQDLTRPIAKRVALYQSMLKNRFAADKTFGRDRPREDRSLFQVAPSTPGWSATLPLPGLWKGCR